jgi:outer membrane protein insertion porin family
MYVGNVYIEGLTFTKEYVIRREILLKEGEPFRADRLRRSIERLYNLGFLDGVEPRLSPTNEYNVADLLLNITEGKPGMFSAGMGYSSLDGLYGTMQIQHLNLLGRAQRLNLSWEFGSRRQNYDISWTEPWFMNRPMSLQLKLFNWAQLQNYGTVYSAYQETRRGGSLGLGPRLGEYLNLLFTYTYEDVEISNISSQVDTIIFPSHDITSSLNSQIIWDSRDNIFDASRGMRQSFGLGLAGGPLGGSVNYLKTVARTTWFWPSFWKFVFSVNGQVAWIDSFYPSNDVPIYEKFYVGGGNAVRGYKDRGEIGPIEGGKAMLLGNVEYKFPIVQENNRTVLQGALFFDIGGAWRRFEDMRFSTGSEENLLHSGVGFGIRFVTPVFPLRLDWGYGLNHKSGEELSQFYFNIGSMF